MDFLRSGGQSRSAQYTALDSNDQQLMSRNEQAEAVDDMANELGDGDDGFNYAAQEPSPRPTASNSMYARAQERMTQLRDMARSAASSFAASASSPPARHPSAAARSPPRARTGGTPSQSRGERPFPRSSAVDPEVSLTDRLNAAAAAAEILFEMRANVGGGGGDGGSATGEEADMLTQLRVVCEDHLDVLARTVEGGGVTTEQLLVRAIEVAEQLVAAIGDDEMNANVLAAAEAEAEGAGGDAGAGAGRMNVEGSPGGGSDPATGTLSSQLAAVDLFGGLDVGGGGGGGGAAGFQGAPPASPPPPPPPPTAVPGRPASLEEEEAMIAAAIAASLAETQPAEAPTSATGAGGGGTGAPGAPVTPAPAVGLPPPPPAGPGGGPNLIDF